MEKLYIVIPAYNESENIRELIEGWYPVLAGLDVDESSRLIIVDDGSTDDTLAHLAELQAGRPLLEVVTKPNGGHGPAVIHGYRLALARGAGWVFQTDSDGQTDPSEFAAFWDARQDSDAVFGVRSNREDGVVRVVVEWVLRLVLRATFGVMVPDANAPFRLMKARPLESCLAYMPFDFNLPNALLTVLFVRGGWRVKFKEISFRTRRAGKNTINIRKIISIGVGAVRDFRNIAANLRISPG